MLLKAGVDISRLKRMIRKTLPVVEGIYLNQGQELVITETFAGVHGAGSLHYADQAYDVRLPRGNKQGVRDNISSALGANFDVILETSHIHIEYDPN